MPPARPDRDDVRESARHHWCGTVGAGPVTQLSSQVEPPSAHGTVALQCDGKALSAPDDHGVDQPAHLHRHITVRAAPISQFSVAVLSPCPYGAVALHGQPMTRTS